MESGKFDEKDITNLKNIRKYFENKVFHCYLIFSKTADAFSDCELNRFKELKEENIFPILFTNKELEPYMDYEGNRKSNLPRQYPFTLEDMAINSVYIYLRDS